MYVPVGQQEGVVEQRSNEQNWRQDYDRDYSKYMDPSVLQQLEDLPRATSAPPHLQERLATASAEIVNRAPNLEGMDSYADVRYDEDYAKFYEMNSDKGRLPPPIDGNALFNDMQTYMAQQQQQLKDNSPFAPGPPADTFGPNPTGHHYGMPFSGQTSISRRGLETVEEQPFTRKHSVDDSLAEALQQLQMGSEIQRPGSQPAPNLIQALAAGAGHIRSASAFPRFDVDGFPGMTANGPTPTSSPVPVQMAERVGGDALNLNATALQQGNAMYTAQGALDLQAAYHAAYQAAMLQTQNNPQMVMPQGGFNVGDGVAAANFGNGLTSPNSIKQEIPGIQKRDSVNAPPVHNYFPPSTHNVPHQNMNNQSPVNRFDVYPGPEQLLPQRDDRGPRGRKSNNRRPKEDPERFGVPAADAYFDNQYFKFTSIEEVVGQVIQVAKDQHGCRFLQKKFDEGRAQSIAFVFPEILENIVYLMKDPFGNYLIQKLLDKCSDEQRTEVVKAVAEKGELVTIALSTHGTRAVQKLIETLSTKEQRRIAIEALKPGVVHLIKDLNGNHVVQRCLQRLGPEDSQFIYDAAIGCCVDIASHRHGCCVLQRCIDFATHEQRQSMIMEISANALVLSQDAFGNYVVQYVLDLGQPEASQCIMTVLAGHYSELAIQKFSSNVVEKCLKLGGLDDARELIIREIMNSPSLPRLLQDQYGNYVIQSALTVTSGSLHQSLVEATRPYLPSLRGTPHGRRILQKVLASLKDPFTQP